MQIFTDNRNRTWNIEVTISTIKRVDDLIGVNLLDVAAKDDFLSQLSTDPILLCNILYAVCKPQADKQDISDEEFGEGLAGDVIAQATDALIQELVNFFPQSQRSILSATLAKMKQAEGRIYKIAQENLDSRLDAEIESAVAKFIGSFGKPQAKSE